MIDFSKAGGSYMIVKILQNVSDFLTGIDYYAITDNLGKIAKVIGDIFQYIPQILTVLKDIALSVAIFYGLRGLLGTFKFLKAGFYAFKSGGFIRVLQWLMLKFGGEVGRNIVKSMITGAVKNSLKGVIASVLGVSGPLGWLFGTLILFLFFFCSYFYLLNIYGKKVHSSFDFSDKKQNI